MRKTSEVISMNILRQNLEEYIRLEDSTLRSGTKSFRMKMIIKFQRISRMVFPHGVSWDPPGKHHGGGCSKYDIDENMNYSV